MRILLVVHQFFPHYSSGTEVLTRSVARELNGRGHEVRVLTGFPAEQALEDEARCDEYDFEGIHVYRFHHAYTPMAGQTSMIEIGYDNRLAADYFGRILKRYMPDVVHFFHLNRLGTGLIERVAQAGIPAFMTPTDFWVVCPTGQLVLADGSLCLGPDIHAGNCVKHVACNTHTGPAGALVQWLPGSLVGLVARFTLAGMAPPYPYRAEVKAISSRLHTNIVRLNRLNGIVATNRFMSELLVRHGVLPGLITQSSFGIDLPEDTASNLRQPSRSPLRVGFIGTLAPHKGCHILVDAFKVLPHGKALLEIYGNTGDFPEYSNDLQRQAEHHKSIAFRGTFPNAGIAEVLSNLDVLVVPSIWYENNPLVIYSAQAARCPVVASAFPGIAEVIRDEDNGLLFEAGNVQALASKLCRLIDEPDLADRLSASSVKPKSTRVYVDELLGIWKAQASVRSGGQGMVSLGRQD